MRIENVFPVTVLIGFDIRTGVAVGHLLTLAKKTQFPVTFFSSPKLMFSFSYLCFCCCCCCSFEGGPRDVLNSSVARRNNREKREREKH